MKPRGMVADHVLPADSVMAPQNYRQSGWTGGLIMFV